MGFQVNDIVKTGGIPMHIIKPLIDAINIPVFVETGTAGGDSVIEAKKHFKFCYTIELFKERINIETDNKWDNVSFYYGNTIRKLPEIIDFLLDIKSQHNLKDAPHYEYVLFFLDAHYSDEVPNTSEYKECYILEELEIISRYREDSLIIIDDARLFLGQPPYPLNPKDWCGIQDIFVLLKEKFPNHYSTIIDDYIVSIPDRIREPLDEHWRNNFHIRYPNAETKLKSQARDVWQAVSEYLKT